MKMKRSPAAIAERLVWQFYHRGAEGSYTKRFSSFDANIQARLMHLAEIGAEEVPAIAAYTNDENWIVLTSQRLIWDEEGIKRQVSLTEIDKVDHDRWDAFHAKMPHLARFKDKPAPRLMVFTKQGKLDFACEPRGPFFGFLNVLMMVTRMNHPLDGGPPRI